MIRTRLIFIILAVSAAFGWQALQPVAAAEGIRLSFPLGDARMSMVPPRGARLIEGDPVQVVLGAATRTPHVMELGRGDPESTHPDSTRLANGRLHYTVEDHEGGSGGAYAILSGDIRLTGTDITVGVTCTAQSEFTPDPRWCLPYLASLRPGR